MDDDFVGFERKGGRQKVFYVCMTQYDASMPNVEVAFKPEELNNTLGEFLANNGMTQLRIAETEKYAHVTFFFNGGREVKFDGEDRILVASPKVATYDLQPEMSANEGLQKKEQKRQQELMDSMEIGDYVLTTSGFYGVVIDITDEDVIVEFGSNKNCRIPMQKSAIMQVEKPENN